MMLYLGIDQHKSQITANLRSEDGDVILQRQVGARWERVRAFFEDLARRAETEDRFRAQERPTKPFLTKSEARNRSSHSKKPPTRAPTLDRQRLTAAC